MQTGIYLDYVCDDVTAAALRLAGLFQRESRRVNFLSGRANQSVHSLWDSRVMLDRNVETAKWTKRSDECVWFHHDAKRFRAAVATRKARRHILVPRWHDLRSHDFDWLGIHDTIVCPSPHMEVAVSQAMRETSVRCPVRSVYWSSGLKQVTKRGYLRDAPSLMATVDDYTMRQHGDKFIRTLCELLQRYPKLTVTVAADSVWPRRLCKEALQLVQGFDDRIKVRCGQPMDQRLVEIHQHDWLWVASVRGTTGFPVQEALACGVPVIVWDIEPFNEIILNLWNGRVVRTNCKRSELGAPTADWTAFSLSKVLDEAFRSEEELIFLQEQDWLLEAQEADFQRFWDELLEKN